MELLLQDSVWAFFEKYPGLADFPANELELHLFKGRIEDVEASKWKP